MSNLATTTDRFLGTVTEDQQISITEKVIANNGNLTSLTAIERKLYYLAMCRHYGLDPFSNPFDYLEQTSKNGSILKLYPNQVAANQIARRDRISTKIISRETLDGMYVVIVEARTPDGRSLESTGAAEINAYGGKTVALKKAETQARRRAILALSGLAQADDEPNRHAEVYDPPMDTMDFAMEAIAIQPKTISQAQIDELGDLIKSVGITKSTAKEINARLGFKTSREITVDKFEEVKQALLNYGQPLEAEVIG